MDGGILPHGSWPQGLLRRVSGRVRARKSSQVELVIDDLRDDPGEAAQQSYRTPDDRVKNGLDIGPRAADDAEDLGRRRLFLQRIGHPSMGLGEGAVLLLQFCE